MDDKRDKNKKSTDTTKRKTREPDKKPTPAPEERTSEAKAAWENANEA